MARDTPCLGCEPPFPIHSLGRGSILSIGTAPQNGHSLQIAHRQPTNNNSKPREGEETWVLMSPPGLPAFLGRLLRNWRSSANPPIVRDAYGGSLQKLGLTGVCQQVARIFRKGFETSPVIACKPPCEAAESGSGESSKLETQADRWSRQGSSHGLDLEFGG